MRHGVREFAHRDRGAGGLLREDRLVAVVGAAEADAVGRPQHDRAVVDHLPVLVGERAVGDLAAE